MRTAGAIRSENAGMSSARRVRIPSTVCLRFSGEGSSSQSKSGPKARPRGVVEWTTGLYSCTTYITDGMTEKVRKGRLLDFGLNIKACNLENPITDKLKCDGEVDSDIDEVF